jgi:hypothetical protein
MTVPEFAAIGSRAQPGSGRILALVVKILTMASPVCDPSSAWAKVVIGELMRRMQPPPR